MGARALRRAVWAALAWAALTGCRCRSHAGGVLQGAHAFASARSACNTGIAIRGARHNASINGDYIGSTFTGGNATTFTKDARASPGHAVMVLKSSPVWPSGFCASEPCPWIVHSWLDDYATVCAYCAHVFIHLLFATSRGDIRQPPCRRRATVFRCIPCTSCACLLC